MISEAGPLCVTCFAPGVLRACHLPPFGPRGPCPLRRQEAGEGRCAAPHRGRVSLCVPGPLHQPGNGAQALLRPDAAQRHLCPLLRRQLQRHPEEVQEHGRPGLRLPLAPPARQALGGRVFLDPTSLSAPRLPLLPRARGQQTGRLGENSPSPPRLRRCRDGKEFERQTAFDQFLIVILPTRFYKLQQAKPNRKKNRERKTAQPQASAVKSRPCTDSFPGVVGAPFGRATQQWEEGGVATGWACLCLR